MSPTAGVFETEAEQAAAALRESEARYRTLFEENPQPTYVFDLETLRFLAVNPAAVAHYGYSRAEFLSMTLADLFLEPDREAVRRSAAQAAAAPGIRRTAEWRQQRKDGGVIDVQLSSHGIDFDARLARLVVALDVTEKRQLEQQVRQGQKMEAVGRLAGGVAHHINNMLAVILGYGEMVKRRLPAADPLQGQVGEIVTAAERAAALTRQLLAFGRKQILRPRILDLSHVVAGLETVIRRVVGKDIDLVTALRDPLGAVKADAEQVEQVILNLVANARDAMPEGGTLRIETAEAGPHVVLAVSDTGHGMDAETLAQVFEPFFTTRPVGKGTGLGLSTVQGVVHQSGGHVEVVSETGKGTTFKVYLPRAEAAARPAAPGTTA
jgi:two-component system, cell cycle sensor histidine kinase and response regulator CckA